MRLVSATCVTHPTPISINVKKHKEPMQAHKANKDSIVLHPIPTYCNIQLNNDASSGLFVIFFKIFLNMIMKPTICIS